MSRTYKASERRSTKEAKKKCKEARKLKDYRKNKHKGE